MRRFLFGIVLVLVVVVVGIFIGYHKLRQNSTFRVMVRAMLHHSPEFTNQEAADAEKALLSDPEDLPTREDLIDYYLGKAVSSPNGQAFEEKREQHILWLIAHHPDDQHVGSPLAWIAPDQPHFGEAKDLWMQKISSSENNVAVLTNAAASLSGDSQISRELANRGLAQRPNDPKLNELLAESFMREMRHTSLPQRAVIAKRALDAWERYEAVEPSESERFWRYQDLSVAAFEANDLPKAKKYANELLAHPRLEVGTQEPNGDEIHIANTVLGRIALHAGDIREAERCLHASVSTKGSPVLDSYGPRMSLAQELLKQNEKETVISYLQECSKFWQYGDDKLKQWESDIRAGKPPDFGDNLQP